MDGVMPKFVGEPKKSKGRSGRLWENARKVCLRNSQVCWICSGECPDFEWPTPQFDSAAIDMTIPWPSPASASVDHVIPIGQLSADDPRLYRQDNLRPAHLRCNSARGDGSKGKAMLVTKTSRNWIA